MSSIKNRERKCSTCKHYQPSPLWRKGWCRNPLLYDRNTNHLVEADSLACNRTFIDYWEPITGPTPASGPQARTTARPRIAPSIPVNTMDAQGNRNVVTGNTPQAGMAAVAPKPEPQAPPRPGSRRERPSLSLVAPAHELDDGADKRTLQLEEVEGPSQDSLPRSAAERIRAARQRASILNTIAGNRLYMAAVVVVALVLLAGSLYMLSRKSPSGAPSPLPTSVATSPAPSPTGLGDPTATVPPQPTVAGQPPPNVIAVGGWVQVTGTGSGLSVRSQAAKSGSKLKVIPDGTKARVIDGPITADGYTWWKLDQYDPKNPTASGWSAASFLQPTAAP